MDVALKSKETLVKRNISQIYHKETSPESPTTEDKTRKDSVVRDLDPIYYILRIVIQLLCMWTKHSLLYFKVQVTSIIIVGLGADVNTFIRTSLGEVRYVCTENTHSEVGNLPTLSGVSQAAYATYK